jgi:hypothetical protein
MEKSALLRALQQEIRRHAFNYFIHEPPSIAQGGRGVVVPGCPASLKRINTMHQFLRAPSLASGSVMAAVRLTAQVCAATRHIL